jgi:putative transposase
MNDWLSAAEIASLELASLPATARGINRLVTRGKWRTRQRRGRGGGVEYHYLSLPPVALADYLRRVLQEWTERGRG